MGEAVHSKDIDSKLVFAVNGQKFELSTVDPSTTLLEFLRTQTKFKGVKLGCGEGGCGACIVLLSKYNTVLKQVEDFTVSSCLTLLCSINECSITTTEGLGSSKSGFHPIHERISGFHASQCGFCSPGMCMSLYSAIINAEKIVRPEPTPGFSKLSVSEAEKSIAGNLCRCTGYRPIIDACKSFASDVDMEDLGINSFWRKGEPEESKVNKLPLLSREHVRCTFPKFLDKEKRLCLSDAWHSPASIEELQKILGHVVDIGSRTKLVVGNTGMGYYKEAEYYDKYIDLRYIPELSMVRRDDTGIELGATVTISRAIKELKEKTPECVLEDAMVFEKIANHMEKIASVFIRNSASIGGNLIMAQRSYFPSDIATILIAVGSVVDLASGSKRERITLEEFLKRPPFDVNGVLLRVKIPTSSQVRSTSKTKTRMLFETYRAAPRPLGNALPHVNASFSAEVSPSEATKFVMIKKCRLVFGAFGTKHAMRAGKAEEFLTGKILNADVLREAIKFVKASIVPEEGTPSHAYKSSVAATFLFQFLSPFIESDIGHPLPGYNSVLDGSITDYEPNSSKTPSLLSSAKQAVESSKEYYPVGEPITKTAAALQASGEAIYVDDIPSPPDCLHGAFICSTKCLGRINDIKFKPELPPDLVTAVLSSKDIPKGGENIGSMTLFGSSPLFADDVVQFAGQRLALVVAETQKKADMAANLAVVAYDMEDIEPPILTVQEAVKKSSFFEAPSFFKPKQVGDFSRGMAEADHRILCAEIKLGSQYYFYMETQTALAIPDEDNCMLVYCSSQCPEYVHSVIAKCLGVPENNVRVITRRVGGGFGGKAVKSMPVAAACALAAHKLNRPVRMYLNRKTDMITAGGRHPMEVTYSVGFKSSGKITALNLDILLNAGYSADISPVMPSNMLGTLKKYDWGALSFDIKVCKTNHTSKSAMRAPGEVQGSFIAEAIIEHVASTLSLEVSLVREINLHSSKSLNIFYEGAADQPLGYTLPSIWDKVASSSCYNQRAEKIKQLNGCNKWHKRGISRVPIVHEVLVRATPGKVSILSDGSIAVEVGGIELGQGLWTKVKQMTAFALGAIECDGVEDLLKKVRIIQSDTISLIQGGFTAGSTTSEASCEAVRLCCNILVERLNPLLENLRQQIGSVDWETLISQAHMRAVNLSSSSYFVPDFSAMKYLNYGAAVSEVEINILTGETTILRSDIIYDCGQSLNPAVDLGQIEGAFVQGIGFFMLEEYLTNSEGLVTVDGTWTYKIPTIDTIPKEFNVEVLNSGHHQKRVLSSKASGEPPLLLAVSVHCATRAAIKEARKQLQAWNGLLDGDACTFQLPVPATMPVVKELCGLDIVERYLEYLCSKKASS